jgi:hypothetical protein
LPRSSSGSAVADKGSNGGAAAEDYSGENLDEVLLTELTRPDGTRGYVVYRNGGLVDAAELEELCDKVGWPRRPQNKVQAALANSFLVATLTLEEQPPASSSDSGSDGSSSSSSSSGSSGGGGSSGTQGRLIGLARCTSDGAFNATLWDVLVDPEFQGQVGWEGGRQCVGMAAGGSRLRLGVIASPARWPCSCPAQHTVQHAAAQGWSLLSALLPPPSPPTHRAWARRLWRA